MTLGSIREYAAEARQRVEAALVRRGYASAILMYHRVAVERHDPWDLCVTPENFAEQMSVLTSLGECVELRALARQRWSRGSAMARFAVTFDDGYVDNLENALPILERFGVPATIFVASDSLGSTREFWWDALERCVLSPHALPARLALDIGGFEHRWEVGQEPASAGSWRADSEGPVTARQSLFLALWNLLVVLGVDERDRALDKLMDWAGADPIPPPGRRPIGPAEFVRLSTHPLVQIGCHTRGHASLPDLSPRAQWAEMKEGRAALERLLGRRVTTFCYPYGRHNRYSSRAARRLFELACTSRPGLVTPLVGRWMLPRLQAVDGGGQAFARSLEEYLPSLPSEGAFG